MCIRGIYRLNKGCSNKFPPGGKNHFSIECGVVPAEERPTLHVLEMFHEYKDVPLSRNAC